MKATLKTTLLLVVCSLALALGGCSEKEKKVELPGQAASATEKSADKESASDDDESAGKSAQKQADGQQADGQPSPAGSADAGEQLAAEKPAVEEPAERRLSGSFEPRRTSSVAANVGGIIREVYVDEGDVVKEGDRLVNIAAEDYQLRVEQARAGVEAAKAQVETVETQYNRTMKLLEQEAVPQAQADTLAGNLAGARAQLAQARAGLRLAQKARADAVITAPYAGVITEVQAAEGNFAAPGPSPLVQLAEVQHLYLRVTVPEEYAADIQKGDMLAVRVPALGRSMELPVARINPNVAQGSRSFDVIAEVENPNLQIRPGMFAEVTLAGAASGGGPVEQQQTGQQQTGQQQNSESPTRAGGEQ